MKQRIMTLKDLYNFCIAQNFEHFDAKETDTEIVVCYNANAELSSTNNKYREGLIPFVADAYHDGINLNKSEITSETLTETLPSAMLRPVLANIVTNEETGEKDFGSHDFTLEEDENGNEVIHYIEQPVGVVFGENTIVYDEEANVNRARLHGYLFEGYCQDAIDIINRRGKVDCSVELHVRAFEFSAKTRTLILNDFYVMGLTLLGATVRPGMANSNVTLENFSIKGSSQEDSRLVEVLEKLNETLAKFHIDDLGKEEPQMEDFKEEVTPVEDVVDTPSEPVKEEVTVEEIPTEEPVDTPEEVVDEPVPADESALVDEEKEVKPEKYSVVMTDGSEKAFQLSLSDIQYALSSLVNATYSEADNCWYSVTVFEDSTLVMQDFWTSKAYRQSYTRDENNFALSGERVEVFANWLTAQEESALAELKRNFEEARVQLNQYIEKENTQKKNDILNSDDYAVIRDNQEFEALIADVNKYSLEEVQAKCDAMLLSYAKAQMTFAVKEPKTIKVKTGIHEAEYKPYGNLFG